MSNGVDNKIRKSVSFNKTKPQDRARLKFIGRKNFSGYVKKLIDAAMEAEGIELPNETTPKKENSKAKLQRLKQEMKKTSNNAGPKLFTPRE